MVPAPNMKTKQIVSAVFKYNGLFLRGYFLTTVTGHNYSESPNSGHTSDTKCCFKTIIIMMKTLVLFNIFVENVIPFFFYYWMNQVK